MIRFLIVLGALVLSAPASAQVTVTLTGFVEEDGTVEAQNLTNGVRRELCQTGRLRFSVSGTGTNSNFDVWHDNAAGLDCATAANARVPNSMRTCINVGRRVIASDVSNTGLEIPLSWLEMKDGTDGPPSTFCAEDRDRSPYNLLFIATTGDAPVTGDVAAGTYASVPVYVDTKAPSPPTGLADATGAAPTLTWTAPDGEVNPNLLRYSVRINRGGCGPDAGAADYDDPEEVTAASYTVDLGPDGLDLMDGESVGVEVATIDQAGNVGEYSAPACATRSPTFGLCDAGGCPSSCSLAPMSAEHGTMVLLGVVGLALVRRRRR